MVNGQEPEATPTPNHEVEITHVGGDVFLFGGRHSAPMLTPEIGGYVKKGPIKTNFFSFGDFELRQHRALSIMVHNQTVSIDQLPAVRFMAEEAYTRRWAVRAGPAVDLNQVPVVNHATQKAFKTITVAWLKGLVNEPSSQIKISYVTQPLNWNGIWISKGFLRLQFGPPDVFQPGLNYTRTSWRGVGLRVEYNKDRFGQRINFGPTLDLLKLVH